LDNLEKAEEMYEKSLDEEPFNDYVWLSLGLLLERQERNEEALQAYDFALTVNDSLEAAVLSKANLLMFAERYNEAIDALTSYLATGAESEQVLCFLGECYEYLGDIQKSVDYYRKALERDRNMADAYWGIGKILRKQGDYENAISTIDYALQIEPENPDYLITKGEIFMEIGSTNAALDAFKTASELCPNDVEILAMITLVLEIIYPDVNVDELKNCTSFSAKLLTMLHAALLYYRTGDTPSCRSLIWQMEDLSPACRDKFFEILPEALENPEMMMRPYLPF
jgi:tetratricopeptide (TPR) repeat protein